MILISLGGIPPLFGFLIKWISLELLSDKINFYIVILLIFNSLVRIFFYLRLIFVSIIYYFIRIKLNLKFINFFEYNNNLFLINWFILIILLYYEIF